MTVKRVLVVLAVLLLVGWWIGPASATALTITQTFCVADSDPVGESSTCTTGLGATLTIEEVDEANRIYDVILTLDTDSLLFDTTTHTSIEGVQFAIEGYSGTDYEATPTVVGPDGVWTVHFDSVNAGANSCNSDQLGGQNVCAGGSTSTGDLDIWTFTIDLDDSVDPITEAVNLNLRAVSNHNVLLSPDFGNIPDDSGTAGPGGGVGPGGVVPEPASLLLLGSGLALVASRFRRQRPQRQC